LLRELAVQYSRLRPVHQLRQREFMVQVGRELLRRGLFRN